MNPLKKIIEIKQENLDGKIDDLHCDFSLFLVPNDLLQAVQCLYV